MALASSSKSAIGTNEKSVGMNADELVTARRRGGPTFSPRRRNRLVCNQAPRLGLISSRQADILRGQVYPRKGGAKATKVKIRRIKASLLNNLQIPFGYWLVELLISSKGKAENSA